MESRKSVAFIMLKIMVVLFIPYSWLISTSQMSPSQTYVTTTFLGTWGEWIPGTGYMPYINYEPPFFWEQSQILFSLLFILPLLSFALFFGKRVLDRTCIMAAGVSVLLSFAAAYLMVLDFHYDTSYLVVPRVVSLAAFVFVFWPLLRNSWPSLHSAETIQPKQGVPFRLRRILSEVIPTNMSGLVWIILVVFPAVSTVDISLSTGTALWYDLSISGGLSTVAYSYMWIAGEGFYPAIYTGFFFGTASLASLTGLLLWTLSIWLGITTLRCVQGKSTIQQVCVLAIVIILVSVIPATLTLISGRGLYIVPLPFFSTVMLLIAKFAHAPSLESPANEDMISVPLGTRISSIFHGKPQLPDVTGAADGDEQTPVKDEK